MLGRSVQLLSIPWSEKITTRASSGRAAINEPISRSTAWNTSSNGFQPSRRKVACSG